MKILEKAINFEPKKENRYIIKFGKPFNISEDVVKGAQRPSFQKTKKQIVVLNGMI